MVDFPHDVTLGELVDDGFVTVQTGPFGTQLKASEYSDTGVPILNVRNLGYGGLREAQLERVPRGVVVRLSGHILEEGDIVLGRKGAVDRHVLITAEQVGWMQGSDCIRLRFSPNSPVDPAFLSKLFMTEGHKKWMEAQCSHGATMTSLNQDIIRRIEVRFPDERQQHRITAVLSAFDGLIEINQRRIELLEELARALFREWFVRFRIPGSEPGEVAESELGQIPNGWSVAPLSEFAELATEGVDPTSVGADDRYVGLGHLPRRHTTLREWGAADSVTSRKLRFERGDTLFGKIRPYFHKVVWAPFGGLASSDTIILRPRPERSLTAFVNTVASSDHLVAQAVATSNGTKMPRADSKALLSYLVAVPDDRALLEFEHTVRRWVEWSAELVQQNHTLLATRDLLLPRLVTGRIDISDLDLGALAPAEQG